jgi:ArsR family transcriptional regulator, arsenate/arsenite/antimonite-responsive transcriptional repressor
MPDKSNAFDPELIALAEIAQALSHPARIAIIRFLNEKGPSTCNPIIQALPLSQPAVSRHLKELKQCGLLDSQSCGASVCYRVNTIQMQKFCEVISRKCMESPNLRVDMLVSGETTLPTCP